jgi:two-component system LytT family sensor kinase
LIGEIEPIKDFLLTAAWSRRSVSTTLNVGELLNLVGLSMGVVLYAMLLAMVVRAARTPGTMSRSDPLLVLTSLLGLVWNLCALTLYELPRVGFEGPFPYVGAVGFGALGFLPAVVVHSVLRGERQRVRGVPNWSVAAIAYSVAAVAAGLHLASAWSAERVPAPLGMRLLTYVFVALILPLGGLTRRQPGSRRALWAAALATFAVSALHLSQLHQGDASWPVELVGHHASLPLAIAILYQDYPFALADLFLKRALALLTIVGVAFATIATFGIQSAAFAQFIHADPRQVSILVTLWVATALLYPSMKRVTAWFVDKIVLRRPDYSSLRADIARKVQASDDISTVLSDVCALLAPALSAPSVTWSEWRPRDGAEVLGPVLATGADATAFLKLPRDSDRLVEQTPPVGPIEVIVTVPTSDQPHFVIAITRPTGGRRLLSGDLDTLEAIAAVVARRIDAIRLSHERFERELREQEMGKLATEAELRALRAQINPHFLFNALTTIGYLIQTAPPRAFQTLLRLTSLLRAVLRSEGEFTTLGRELEMIESYLDIELARFEQRLQVTIDVPSRLRDVRLPPLILQPLVENAIKHGIGHKQVGGEVTVRARVDHIDNGHRQLSLVVSDTGAGTTEDVLRSGRRTGVGLTNVERRLECHYGKAASFAIHTSPGLGTTVEIRMPVELKFERASANQVSV